MIVESMIKVVLTLQLLLLLSAALFANLTVFSRLYKWDMPLLYQVLSSIALGCYLLIAFFSFIFLLIGDKIASELLTFIDVLYLISMDIGVWLIPVGLTLSLIGAVRLERGEVRARG